MKAWVLYDIGDIRFEDVDKPKIKDNEVLVAVKAAGICGSDIPRIYETGAHNMPIIPGHEFSGQVVETGEKVDNKWLDKRVGVFPLIPCGKCELCKKKLFEMCRNYNYLGSRCNGGFAEYCAVPEWNLIELPDNVTYEQAAMLEPMSVAVHAIRRAAPKIDDKVVVHGLGTIGLLIIMFLMDMGIENIIAVGNKDFQKSVSIKIGVKEENFCNIRTDDVSEFICKQTVSGADVYFECVGRNETISSAVDNTAPSGKVLLVGNPCSDISFEKNIYWKILRNQITVTGTWNSTFTHDDDDDWSYVIERLEKGTIKPKPLISVLNTLNELSKVQIIITDKNKKYIKPIITINNN